MAHHHTAKEQFHTAAVMMVTIMEDMAEAMEDTEVTEMATEMAMDMAVTEMVTMMAMAMVAMEEDMVAMDMVDMGMATGMEATEEDTIEHQINKE